MNKFNTILPLFFILSLVCAPKSYAQQDVAAIPVSIYQIGEVTTATSANGEILLLFQSGRKVQVVVLGPDYQGKEEHTIELAEANRRDLIVGATIDNEKICIYLENETKRSFTALLFMRITEDMTYNTLGVIPRQYYMLRYTITGDKFMVITVPKNSNIVHTFISDRGMAFDEFSYTIELPDFYTRLCNDNNMLNEEPTSEVGIEYVRYDVENNIKSSYPGKKMYVLRDKIYFTFDDPGLTHIIALDLQSKTVSHQKIESTLEKADAARNKQGNSFLFEHYLFRVTVSPEQLKLTITDLNTMQVLNAYNLYPEDAAPQIVNGDYLEENTMEVSTMPIKDTKSYFNRIMNGYIAVAVNRIDSLHISSRVGSYAQSTNWNGGVGGGGINMNYGTGIGSGYGTGMTVSFGSGWGGPYMGMGYPGYAGPGYPYSGGNYAVNISQVYFPSVFEDSTFNHTSDQPAPPFTERIQDYERITFKKKTPEHIKLIPVNDNLMLFGYYGKNHTYRIVEFRR